MHVRLRLGRPEGRTTDLQLTVDATATVGDVAAALFAGDPARAGAPLPDGLTLQVGTGSARLVDPERTLIEAGVRSGSVVTLARWGVTHSGGEDRGPAVATLRVLSGPDAGREFPLPAGVSHVGRARGADVRLADPRVSKNHARVVVGESVEIVDAGSANGLVMGRRRVARAVLGSADVVALGDTTVSVVQTQLAGTVAPSSPSVEFNRSPRVLARFPGQEHSAPKAPGRPVPQRFPVVSMLAPLVVGLVLLAVTRNVLSLVFVALSPLLMIGMYVDTRATQRREQARSLAVFRGAVTALERELAAAQDVERAVRLSEAPSVTDVVDAAYRLGPVLWSYRPEHPQFLTVRLGVAALPSRSTVTLGELDDALPEHVEVLTRLRERFATVAGVPVVADLRSCGTLGVAGPRGTAEGVARGIVMQLVGLHSPAELVLCVLASPLSRITWEWTQWLPHVGSPFSPLAGDHLADDPGSGAVVLARLEDVVAQREDAARDGVAGALRGPLATEEPGAPPTLPAVVVVVEDDAPVDRARLTRLAERGADVGVHVVWVAPMLARLPAVCRTHVAVDAATERSSAGHVRLGRHTHTVSSEALDRDVATQIALVLAPVVDVGVPLVDESDLPRTASYLALAGLEIAESPRAVVERWQENHSLVDRTTAPVRRRGDATLRALVGSAGGEPMFLDLRTQGPHALVGGTTGSGKSEFLQSWVLGMAAAHSPDRVSFLLVDYKGGTAFADCVDLPHTVGLVTDLSPHLVRRALTSLKAELTHREHLLNRKRVKDLVELERSGDPEAPPSLVIVVDEFAALATEVPEFVDGVVDVAQRGRSLGLHLVLATQRPAGVIRDNLRANTNLRIALRMADEDDSTDVLGTPMAAHFDPAVPGRAAAKTGPGRVRGFQTGYAGGVTGGEPPAPRIDVSEMRFGTGDTWEPSEGATRTEVEPGPSDIARVVATVSAAAQLAGVPAPRKPWLEELATVCDVRTLENPRTDTRLPFGTVDRPAEQAQPTAFFEPDADGNMAVFGTGGSGKSTALRTIAVAAALTGSAHPVQVYGLDMGSGGLRPLDVLPHVGAVVAGEDEERTVRLVRMLRDLVNERAARYSEVQAATIGEYRQRTGRHDEPRVLLLVDGIGAFREAYEHAGPASCYALFSQLATDGRAVGVHLVLGAERPGALPPSLGSTVQRRLVLRMSGEDDYLSLGVPRDVLGASSPPGRGLLGGNEVQVAVLGGDANVAVQSRHLELLAESLGRKGVAPAPGVGRLPELVALTELPPTVDGRPVVGVADATLTAHGLPVEGTFLLSGPPGSGRTTALHTVAQALRRARPTAKLVLLTPRASPLLALQLWDSVARGEDEVAERCRVLIELVGSGSVPQGGLAVLVEGLTAFSSGPAEGPLDDLVRCAAAEGHLVVGEAETSTWSDAYTLAKPFKSGRRGLLLTPSDGDESILNASVGRLRRTDFPPGRGLLISAGRSTKLQLATPD